MSNLSRKLMMGAAGGAAEGEYIEDLFSTYLYDGNSSTQTITNGIDVSGEGGLVWVKRFDGSQTHVLQDTERGTGVYLPISTGGNSNAAGVRITSFNSNGFSVGSDADVNFSSQKYASWTFREAPGFFDVVTYTGNGVAGRTISHNLGSVPGCIIVKCLSTSDNWPVYHQNVGATKFLILDGDNAAGTNSTRWNNTAPTSSVFTVGSAPAVNNSGDTYVAYLFAHDEQIFGENADQSVIKCGSYTGNGSTGQTINLGFEPQWLMIKCTSRSGVGYGWGIYDAMRNKTIAAESSNGQFGTNRITFKSNGFEHTTGDSDLNESPETYIYIAIRRGPMKTPTDATTVFAQSLQANDTTNYKNTFANGTFPPDFAMLKQVNVTSAERVVTRLTGDKYLQTTDTSSESNISFLSGGNAFGETQTGVSNQSTTASAGNVIIHTFRRAPGFFDVVTYTGDGVAGARNIPHGLGVRGEMLIVKRRDSTGNWGVNHTRNGSSSAELYLNLTSQAQYYVGDVPTVSTSTYFTIPSNAATTYNASGAKYVAYIFGSLSGVSKTGVYTGTGSTLNIDCGFSAGARFVLIKRSDSTSDWYVWDTARGIVAGNDPYLLLNSTAAEVTTTDYIDPYASGFTVTSSAPAALNASGGIYLFLAIA